MRKFLLALGRRSFDCAQAENDGKRQNKRVWPLACLCMVLLACGSSKTEFSSGLFLGTLAVVPAESGTICDEQHDGNTTVCCPAAKSAGVLVVKVKNNMPPFADTVIGYQANRWDAKVDGNQLIWHAVLSGSDLGCPATSEEDWAMDVEGQASVSSKESLFCASGNEQLNCSYQGQLNVSPPP